MTGERNCSNGRTRTAVLLKQQLDERLKSCRLSFEPAAGKPDAPQLLHKITCG